MTSQKNIKTKDGYIALISAIIISALLTIITLTSSFTGFFGRYNILESEYKERSSALAEACADTAMVKLGLDPLYLGNETILVASDSCRILPIATTSSSTIIQTKGEFPLTGQEKSITNIEVIASTSDLSIVSWKEIPYLP